MLDAETHQRLSAFLGSNHAYTIELDRQVWQIIWLVEDKY